MRLLSLTTFAFQLWMLYQLCCIYCFLINDNACFLLGQLIELALLEQVGVFKVLRPYADCFVLTAF
jgi:hypothetical protein